MTRRTLSTITLATIALAILAVDAQASDHFESRRRDAEYRRHAGSNRVVTRSWGGPTTDRNWRTPTHHGTSISRRVPGYGSGAHGLHRGGIHGNVVFVPGHWDWCYGRRIYVPPCYRAVPGHHIHIEHRHIVR